MSWVQKVREAVAWYVLFEFTVLFVGRKGTQAKVRDADRQMVMTKRNAERGIRAFKKMPVVFLSSTAQVKHGLANLPNRSIKPK